MPTSLLSQLIAPFWATKQPASSDNKMSARLSIQSLEDRSVPSATDLGIANEFNAFAFDDYSGYFSDVQGRVAVGGTANLNGYSIGTSLENSRGGRDDLIVQDDLMYQNGQIFNGNGVHGGDATLFSVGTPNGEIRQEADVIAFDEAREDLETKSVTWAGYFPNGSVQNNYGSLVLTGNDPNINVFNLESSQLAGAMGLTIDAPSTATVLINVSGEWVGMQNFGFFLEETDRSKVLFNLHEAENVVMQGIGVEGNILAPKAHMFFANGQMNGTLVVESFDGNGELHSLLNTLNVVPPPVINSSLTGNVFQLRESNPVGVEGVTVKLTGALENGTMIDTSSDTDEFGNYSFAELAPGTYTVTVQVPDGFTDGQEFVGSLGGTAGTAMISDIMVLSNDSGSGYNFELVPTVLPPQPSPPPPAPDNTDSNGGDHSHDDDMDDHTHDEVVDEGDDHTDDVAHNDDHADDDYHCPWDVVTDPMAM